MEIVLPNTSPAPVSVESKTSGAEYLREKQQRSRPHAEPSSALLEKIKELVLATKTTDMRLYLLVPRDQIEALRGHLNGFQEIRISGPWPAAEFLEETR